MRALAAATFALGFGAVSAFAAVQVPTCNGWDPTGAIPQYFAPGSPTGTTPCTDYFGVSNWANSPLPSGTITGLTLVMGGTGYATPVVVINDATNPGGTCAATATQVAGVISGFGALTGTCSGYTLPQITIADMGPGWTGGPATCGAAPLPLCGSGAVATATLGPPFVGGMPKFVSTDLLPDLKGLLAVSDTTTFPGTDYYEIALVQYTQKMHSSLPPTTLRGYVQVPSGSPNACTATPLFPPSYLGPIIAAKKDKAVRVKFTNCLPTGTGGNLFIPTDTTYMGAGAGPGGIYTENRATLHLHGGATPWISDGTPHQWTVPVGDPSPASLQTGVSTQYVPDMYFLPTGAVVPQCSATVTTNCSGGTVAQLPAGAENNPGQGSMTFYWTNQQGGRLMFYHDHAYGITRLNVYAGEAAGYLLADPVEEDMLAAAGAPGTIGALVGGTTPNDLLHLIPLVIQDKTFVPSAAQINATDPTWAGNFGATPLSTAASGNGDLWFPHVYVPNQNPADPGLGNAVGRWDYGAWFFPPQTSLTAAVPPTAVTVPCTSVAFPGQILAPTPACPSCGCPITPNPSGTPESFMDTPVVNGMAYPVLHVAPEAYRFKMLAAGNDRSWHLSLFVPDPVQGMTEVAMLPALPPTTTTPLTATTMPLCTQLNPLSVPSLTIGLATGLLDATGNPLNGTGLPANCWPNFGAPAGIPLQQTMWPADGRRGGVPDPRRAGPAWIQIGTEGGILPEPVVVPSQPVGYEANPRSITITSVGSHGLWIGPAERADVIVDFSKALPICTALGVSPCTLIVYNDAPAPAPASDSRLDYFTGDGDQTPIGGAPNTQPGYGPNTRTVMQIIVDLPTTGQAPFSLPALKTAFTPAAPAQGVFAKTQPQIIVPEAAYGPVYNAAFPNSYMTISANDLTFAPLSPLTFNQPPCVATPPATCAVLDQKAIQELFTLDYGRMNATMGTERPLTNFQTQTTIPLGYVDWPTEIIQQVQTQLWKVTHNGVDSHFIHFHLFNVQVINRVGWDGSLRQPDQTELGWKETVRMNPLEDILVALQPITPVVPFPLPDSIRPMDVTMPVGVASPNISGLDPNTGNATVTKVNQAVNFGWEYVWHCHILGHEENDMMRPMIFQVAPPPPTNFLASSPGPPVPGVALTWTDMSANESSFTVQRDTVATFNSPNLTTFTVDGVSINTQGFSTLGYGQTVTFQDGTAIPGTGYLYRVAATDSFLPSSPNPAPFQALPMSSAWVGPVSINATALVPTVTFTGAPATAVYGSTFVVTATTNSSSVPTITGTAGICSVGPVSGTAASATATVTMTAGAGVCTLTANWAPDIFFTAATATQTTNALPAALTITANSAIKAYGQTLTFLGTEFTALGLVAPDSVASVTLTSAGAAAAAAVGTYPIVPSAAVAGGATNLANYTITYVNGTLTVNPAALTITANNAVKPYASVLTFLGTEFTATGLIAPDTVTSVTLTSAGAAATAAAGAYPIVPSAAVGTGLTNYVITYVNGTLTVNPAALTITANNATKAYGQTLTFLGTEFVAVGLLNADAVTSVTLTSAGAPATAAVGSYPIVPSAAVGTGLTNYVITYVNGTLTVNAAALTITANNLGKVYGTTLTFLGTEFTTLGLLNADAVTSVTLTSTGTAAAALVGPYPIVPSAAVGTGLANYTITYVNGTLTVNPAALTITANNGSKVYGTAPIFAGTEFTTIGLANADTVTSVTLTSAGTAATAAVGSYPIVPSAAVGTGLANYTITYLNGTFTVTPAGLTVTANNLTKVYGQPLTFAGTEFTTVGLLNADTVTSVTLASTGATATAALGTYPITASAAVGTGLTNYTITYVDGTLTVNQAPSLTTITSNLPNPSIRGQVVTVGFGVAPQFTGTPTGNVTVTASTGETCTGALTAGAGGCNLTFATSGARTLTASYSGDTNFLASTSAAVTQTVSSVVLSTASLLFGNQILFSNSAGQTVSVTNVGTGPLTITAINTTAGFNQSNNCPIGGALRVGRSCSITVRFRPAVTGVITGSLSITDNDPTSPQRVSLTGTGVAPAAVLSPTALFFGPVTRNTTKTMQITLSNPGAAPLTINSIALGGTFPNQFSQGNNCGGSLAAGASCTINVRYTPTRPVGTAVSATLTVTDNAGGIANSTQTATLQGTVQ
ncbi:MAG TPA: MBG domain-containing protein [bacterium]